MVLLLTSTIVGANLWRDAHDALEDGWVWRADEADAGGSGATVVRYDYGELRPGQRTAEGFLLAEGYAARPGVLTYVNADGTTRRELVLPEELAKADSLETLGRVPMTYTHPAEGMVDPANVGDLAAGDVDGEVTIADNGFVKVKMAIRRADALAAIDRGEVELSPGYKCRIDATPGVHPVYGAYDAVQRDRRYNHLALVPAAAAAPTSGSARTRLGNCAPTPLPPRPP